MSCLDGAGAAVAPGEKSGAAPSAASASAASAAAARPPEWILLDLMLPDGCGLDVLRSVRARRLASKTCIITGCAADMLNEARRAGAEHTFVKPLDVEQLVEVMTAPA